MFILIIYFLNFLCANYNFSGYYKTYLLNSRVDDAELANLYINFRNNFSYSLDDAYIFNIAYSLLPFIHNPNKDINIFQSLDINNNTFRLIDFNKTLYPSSSSNNDNYRLDHNLDRFNINLTYNYFDIIIGRQSISYGISKLNNPIDVFRPFNLLDFDREELQGVDAVLLKIPLNKLSQLDLAYVFSANFDTAAQFVTYKFNILNTDFRTIFIHFYRNYLLGFNISKTIYDTTLWFENSVIYDDFDTYDFSYKQSIGIDYNFTNLYLAFEYSYNSYGKKAYKDYIKLVNIKAYKNAWTYLLGEQYLSFSYKYIINTILTNNLQTVYNLNDNSKLIVTSFDFNVFNNIYYSIGLYLGIGEYNTEFELYNKIVYNSLSIYW